MRTLEILLVVTTALMLLRISWPLSNRSFGSLIPALVSLGVLALHVLIEKPHWQMVPAYLIIISLALIYLGHWKAEASETSAFWRGAGCLGRWVVLLLGGLRRFYHWRAASRIDRRPRIPVRGGIHTECAGWSRPHKCSKPKAKGRDQFITTF